MKLIFSFLFSFISFLLIGQTIQLDYSKFKEKGPYETEFSFREIRATIYTKPRAKTRHGLRLGVAKKEDVDEYFTDKKINFTLDVFQQFHTSNAKRVKLFFDLGISGRVDYSYENYENDFLIDICCFPADPGTRRNKTQIYIRKNFYEYRFITFLPGAFIGSGIDVRLINKLHFNIGAESKFYAYFFDEYRDETKFKVKNNFRGYGGLSYTF